MAEGKKCSQYKYYMFAQKEKQYPAGVEVTYVCRSCKFEEKVFEDK